jgi:GNAT superfamily N-acetyltransferase
VALSIVPLTPDRWADLERLFGPKGACAGCWCMWWRVTAGEYKVMKGAQNRDAFAGVVAAGDPPGLLAYSEKTPVGWLAIAPRADAAKDSERVLRERGLDPSEDGVVWAATCFFIARGARKQGITGALLDAGVRHARDHGARVVEAFPLVPRTGNVPAAFAWTGFLSPFLKAGFEVVGSPSAGKRVVHRYLR